METLLELQNKRNGILAQAKSIFETATDPLEKAKVPQMLAEVEQIDKQAKQMMDIVRLSKGIEGMDQWGGRGSDPASQVDKKAGFKSWGDFLSNVLAFRSTGNLDARLKDRFWRDAGPAEQKDMSAASGSTGGFLVPEQFQDELMAAMAEKSFFRQMATIMPMRSQTLRIPRVKQTGVNPAGMPNWFGGMRFYWRQQGTPLIATTPEFGAVELAVRELIGYTAADNELVQDSAIPLEAFLSGPFGFAGGVAWMEQFAFLQGTGTGEPLGILHAPATLAVPRLNSDKIQYVDLVTMQTHMLASAADSVWVISQQAFGQIMQLQNSAGFLIFASGVAGGPDTLLGRPYYKTEMLPRLGQYGDIALIDPSFYVIGDRQATTIEATQFDKWAEFKTSWRVMHRVDGQPWLDAPITLQDTEFQVSPFVVLSDAES